MMSYGRKRAAHESVLWSSMGVWRYVAFLGEGGCVLVAFT